MDMSEPQGTQASDTESGFAVTYQHQAPGRTPVGIAEQLQSTEPKYVVPSGSCSSDKTETLSREAEQLSAPHFTAEKKVQSP